MSLTVRMRSSSGGSLSTGEVWDRYTGRDTVGIGYVSPKDGTTTVASHRKIIWNSINFSHIW